MPMFPVGDDGWCTCSKADCNGKRDPHSAGKHPRWSAGQSTTDTAWWQANPGDAVGIDREGSRVVSVEEDGALTAWAAANGIDLVPTFAMASPRENERLFYRLPADFAQVRNWTDVDGKDTADILCKGRAPGPGVRGSEGEFRVTADLPVADATLSLLAWLVRRYAEWDAASPDVVPAEDFEGELPESVLTALAAPGKLNSDGTDTDRSAKTYAVVLACYDAGLSQGETAGVVEDHCAEAVEKFGARKGGIAAEVARIWGGLDDDEPEWLAAGRPPSGTELFTDLTKRSWALARRRGITLPSAAPSAAQGGHRDPNPWASAARDAFGFPTGAAAPPAQRRIARTLASEIGVERVTWLWKDRVPAGELSVLGGREGIGKSLVTCDITAKLTHGTLPGEYFGTPKPVAIVASEDSWPKTIIPRLMAAGADLSMVYRLQVTTGLDVKSELDLPYDNEALRAELADSGAALLILDPLMSRLSGALDSHKDSDVRQALEPLAGVAHDTGCAVVGLMHVNKSGSSDPLSSLMASRAFTAVPRAILYTMTDPNSESGVRKLLGVPKSNLGRANPPLLAYVVAEATVAKDAGGVSITTGQLQWVDGPATGTLAQLLAESQRAPERETATDRAASWLTEWLRERGGRAPSSEAKAAGKNAGHALTTLKRALVQAEVTVESTSTVPRRTDWVLSDDPPPVGSPAGPLARGAGPTGPTGARETYIELTNPNWPAEMPPAQLAQSAQSDRPPARGEPTGEPTGNGDSPPTHSETPGTWAPRLSEYAEWLAKKYGNGDTL